jgi:integrase
MEIDDASDTTIKSTQPTTMYHIGLSKLNATRNCTPSTQTKPTPSTRSRIRTALGLRPTQNFASGRFAQQRALRRQRALQLLAEFDATQLDSLAADDRDYDSGLPKALDVASTFAKATDPAPHLPNGNCSGIPVGINRSLEATTMDLPTTHLDAIDAGASELGRAHPQIAYYQRKARAETTRETYRWAWERTLRSCAAMNQCPMPMSEVTAALVLVDAVNDGLVTGSVRLISTVIGVAHELAHQPNPMHTEAVRSVMRGIARALGDRPDRKVAISVDELRLIRDAALRDPNPARGQRDWTAIVWGFAGAFRRSELVALNTIQLEDRGDEILVHLDHSKTDQTGRGAIVSIQMAKNPDICPVLAMRSWLSVISGPGPLFRRVSKSGAIIPRRLAAATISYILKGYGVVLDLPEDRLGAHSLRAGIVTALIDAGVSDTQTMQHSRHKHHDTLGKYYRPRSKGPNMTEFAGL